MQFGILGPLEVLDDAGNPVAVNGSRRRALLTRLLVAPNQQVLFDRLCEDLWEGSPPDGARSTLASHASLLRHVLGDGRIATRHGGYAVIVLDGELDADRCQVALETARALFEAGDHRRAVATLDSALGLWRGAALADVTDASWARGLITRLDELRAAIVDLSLQCRLALREHHEVVRMAQEAVEELPLRDARWESLLLALYRSGRQAEALQAFQRLRSILGDDHGLEPSDELIALDDAIARRDPALDLVSYETGVGPSRGKSVPKGSFEPIAHNLHVPASGLIGREREMKDLTDLVDHHRLVTLMGTGGVGKTRLALEVARERFPHAPGGVWLVELAPVTESALVPEVVGQVLQVDADARSSPIDRLCETIGSQRILLVLDNCEHLADACALLANELLGRCPQLCILATSREPLRVDGEVTYRLMPLSLPPARILSQAEFEQAEAVRLFVSLMRRYLPATDLTRGERDVIGKICRRLDGIPLALELAAARTSSIGLDDLRRRLDRRFRLLTGGRRNVHPRQQTLWATIDWSYCLLDESEQAVLRRLAVFAGDPVVPGGVAAAVSSLVDKSMVVGEPARRRYRLLETIKEFSAEHLADDLDEAATAQHAQIEHYRKWVHQLAPKLEGPDAFDLLMRLEEDTDNIRATLRSLIADDESVSNGLTMVVDLERFWLLHRREGYAFFIASQRALDAVDPRVCCQALCIAIDLGAKFDPHSVPTYLARARALAEELRDPRLLARTSAFVAIAAATTGDPRARELLVGARKRAREADPFSYAVVGRWMAKLDPSISHSDLLLESVMAGERCGDAFVVWDAWYSAVYFFLDEGDVDGAEDALARFDRLGYMSAGDQPALRQAVEGWVALHRKRFERATECFLAGLVLSLRVRRGTLAREMAGGLACCQEALGNDEPASVLHGFASSGQQAVISMPGRAWRDGSEARLRERYPRFEDDHRRGEKLDDEQVYELAYATVAELTGDPLRLDEARRS
jgi:predicted ATPase/DNA-binding SARP family transcriptional activator